MEDGNISIYPYRQFRNRVCYAILPFAIGRNHPYLDEIIDGAPFGAPLVVFRSFCDMPMAASPTRKEGLPRIQVGIVYVLRNSRQQAIQVLVDALAVSTRL